MTRPWTIHLPAALLDPSQGGNRRGHWTARNAYTDEVKRAVAMMCRTAELRRVNPDGPPPQPVHVTCIRYVVDRGRWDTDNLGTVFKPAVDGLVVAGVLPDGDHWPAVAATTYMGLLAGQAGWTIRVEGVDDPTM